MNLKTRIIRIPLKGVVLLVFFIVSMYGLLQIIQGLDIDSTEKSKVIEAYENQIVAYERYPELYFFDRLKLATLDYWSECLVIGHAFSQSSVPFANHPIAELSDEITDCEELIMAMRAPQYLAYGYYPQYVHADSAIVKLILIYSDLKVGKILLSIAISAMLLGISLFLFLRKKILGIIFLLYFLMTDLFFQGLNFAHGIATLWALILIQIIVSQKISNVRNKAYISLIGGSGYAFLSQMHNPVQFIGLLFLINLITEYHASTQLNVSARRSFMYGSFWSIGGVVTIALHWVIVGVYESWELIISTLESGTSNRININLLNSVYVFFGLLKTQTFNFSLSMISLLILFFIWGTISNFPFKGFNIDLYTILFIFFPTVVVILWFIIMGGHIGHGWTVNLIYTAFLNILVFEAIVREFKVNSGTGRKLLLNQNL